MTYAVDDRRAARVGGEGSGIESVVRCGIGRGGEHNIRQSLEPMSTTRACDGCDDADDDGGTAEGGDAAPTPHDIAAASGDEMSATEETPLSVKIKQSRNEGDGNRV